MLRSLWEDGGHMPGRVKVLIADDHQIVRQGLKLMLSADPEIDVVGDAASGDEAVARVGESSPDVVLMDVLMPGMDGFEATRRIKALYPSVVVVMLAVKEDESCVADAIRAGASGYVLKDSAPELLRRAVHAVWQSVASAERQAPSAPAVVHNLTDARAGLGLRHGRPLTPRERDILGLIVEGRANKEIAAELAIAEDTVKKHVQSIIAKLGVTDRTQAAVKALRTGLVT